MSKQVDEIDIIVEPPKKVVSFKLDVDIIEEMDRLWQSLGYRSRSEFLREAVLYYMQVLQARQPLQANLSSAVPTEPLVEEEDEGDELDPEELSRELTLVLKRSKERRASPARPVS